MAQEKRHLTTEQLSTLLDREVSAEEQARLEAHLSTCAQCEQELTGLRQTVALLHALPQATLPRSFVLPLEAVEPVAIPQAVISMPTRQAQRRTLNPYVRGVLRTMSALAAMIGVVFFLSGVLPALVMHAGSNGSSASTASSGGAAVTSPPTSTQSPHAVINGAMATKIAAARGDTPTSTATPVAAQEVKPQPPGDQKIGVVQHATPSPEPTFFIFNLSVPAGRIGLGMLLVILGLMGFMLFKSPRRRTERAR